MLVDKICLSEIHPNLRMINLYTCTPGFNSGTRRLYDHYFLYVHKGCGQFIIDGKSYTAISGDMFFCPPGIENTIIADEKNPFILSGINFDFVKTYSRNELLHPIQTELFKTDLVTEKTEFHDFEGFPYKLSIPENKVVRELVLEMIDQFNSKLRYWDMTANGMLQTLISKLIQYITNGGYRIQGINKGEEIIKFITSNYTRDIKNEDIASEFHYSADYVNKLVYTFTGLTIKQYILDMRIREAIHLLLNTDLDITEIASKVGFSTVHYFSRIFTRKTGMSPSYFRNIS